MLEFCCLKVWSRGGVDVDKGGKLKKGKKSVENSLKKTTQIRYFIRIIANNPPKCTFFGKIRHNGKM